MKTPSFPPFLCSQSSGPKADSSPKGSRGLGGLKSEFLKPSAARGVRTQDQPAGGKGRTRLQRGRCAGGREVAVSSGSACVSVGASQGHLGGSAHACTPARVWGSRSLRTGRGWSLISSQDFPARPSLLCPLGDRKLVLSGSSLFHPHTIFGC